MKYDGAMKPRTTEYIEGKEAFQRFTAAMKTILAVPHSVIQERIERHRQEAAKNPNRPGPKPSVNGRRSLTPSGRTYRARGV